MAKRILLCDDEIHIIRAAEFKLSRAGYDVECAADGEAGWEAIQRHRPDLVVTDCQMPRLNGVQLIERMREHDATRDIPVYMLTGKGFELSQQDLVERFQIRAILAKPFSPRELLLKVNEALAESTTSADAMVLT